jgi:hypothetical protein
LHVGFLPYWRCRDGSRGLGGDQHRDRAAIVAVKFFRVESEHEGDHGFLLDVEVGAERAIVCLQSVKDRVVGGFSLESDGSAGWARVRKAS